MPRPKLILQVVTITSLILILIIGENKGVRSHAVGEVRSVPVFGQNRPVFLKPSPKPKLILKPPQQLQLKEQKSVEASPQEEAQNADRITQTVYGFLDFVTTIGNTVMVFTPQTKQVEAVNVKVTVTPSTSIVKPTATPESRIIAEEQEEDEISDQRQTKNLEQESQVVIEASEVEPKVFGSFSSQVNPPLIDKKIQFSEEKSQVVPTPAADPEVRTQVNVVSSSPNLGSGEFIEGELTSSEEKEFEADAESEALLAKATPPPTRPTTSSTTFPTSKPKTGFTLKLTPKHMSPVIVTPAFSTPVVVTAQKVNLPPPSPPPPSKTLEPTGLLNQIFETKVNEGQTTVVETKIIGTYIGTQYARLLESSASVVPAVAKIEATKSISFPSLILPASSSSQTSFVVAQKHSTTTTPSPLSTTTTVENDKHVEEEAQQEDSPIDEGPQEEYLEQEQDENSSHSSSSSSQILLEPTPTASEEQTHYILPQKIDSKKPEKIYVSAIPNPNAYSRQPQLYVDINPPTAIVTATPSRGKQFRLSNRFNNRNKNQNSGSDSNELTHPQEIVAVPEDSSTRSGSRSRFGRNRGRSSSPTRVNPNEEVVPTVSVYSHIISATPSRRFKSGGARTSSASPSSSSSAARNKDFSSYKTARGFNPSSSRNQQSQISPTSSTSIYRFKLNRPTGRWRFKPSPKPKVNIIKNKEEDDFDAGSEVQLQSPTNGPVYNQQANYDGEFQHPEETRTESNELVQEIEPELQQQTIRVATITPTEFADLDKFLEIATIKSPYVFQAGNVRNTRFITVTKTFTKEHVQPTVVPSTVEETATLENILATKPPYEKILEGSSDVATLPVIVLNGDMATPPLETITQSFSTTQIMLKTSILPVLYEGVTTLYTLTQSYFITRLVTAHKTVPPLELFQFVPTKSLTEFNTALQEAGSEHREHLLGSESDDSDGDTNYEQIIAPPDELTSVGSDFDPSFMDEKLPKRPFQPKSFKEQLIPRGKAGEVPNPFSPSPINSIQDPLSNIAGLTPEQLAFIRYFTAQNQQAIPTPQAAPQHFPQQFPQHFPQQFPQLPAAAQQIGQFSFTSSPVVVDTTATVVETKTLRLLFGAKPTYTVLYSTRVVPTRMTSYVTASIPVAPTASNPFLNALQFPLAYVG